MIESFIQHSPNNFFLNWQFIFFIFCLHQFWELEIVFHVEIPNKKGFNGHRNSRIWNDQIVAWNVRVENVFPIKVSLKWSILRVACGWNMDSCWIVIKKMFYFFFLCLRQTSVSDDNQHKLITPSFLFPLDVHSF